MNEPIGGPEFPADDQIPPDSEEGMIPENAEDLDLEAAAKAEQAADRILSDDDLRGRLGIPIFLAPWWKTSEGTSATTGQQLTVWSRMLIGKAHASCFLRYAS